MRYKIFKSLAVVLIVGLPLMSCAADKSFEQPRLDGSVLIFPNEKSVGLKDTKPQKEEVYSEKFKLLIDATDRMVVAVRNQKLYEGESISIKGYSFDGENLFSIDGIVGSVRLLEKKNLIVITRYSSHSLQKESEIIDYYGEAVAKLEPPDAVSFGGVSDDKKYVWLAAEILEMPISYEVYIYDLKGEKVAYAESVPRDYSFNVKGEVYQWNLSGLSKGNQ